MKKLNSDGFSVVEVLIIFVILVAIGGLGFYVYNTNKNEDRNNTETSQTDKSQVSSNKPSIPSGYQEYKNTQYTFSFIYPSDWSELTVGDEERRLWDEGILVALESPESAQAVQDFKASGIITRGPDWAAVQVSRWATINDPEAKGGEWIGQKTYSGLEDYFNDPYEGRSKQKIGELSVGSQKAFEVIIGGYGSNYGVMFERDGAVYEIKFSDSDKSSVTEEDKKIIESFKFY